MGSDKPRVSRWPESTTAETFLQEVLPLVEREGYRLSTDEFIVPEILDGLMDNFHKMGDMYCPCRLVTGDFEEDKKLVCPCIPSHRELYAKLGKCWCGLFVAQYIEDDESLMGVVPQDTDSEPYELPLCSLDAFPCGSVSAFDVAGTSVTVARDNDGDVFGFTGCCTHMGADLAQGFVHGETLVCPLHGWKFNLVDGTTNHPGKGLTPFELNVHDGVIYAPVDPQKK